MKLKVLWKDDFLFVFSINLFCVKFQLFFIEN